MGHSLLSSQRRFASGPRCWLLPGVQCAKAIGWGSRQPMHLGTVDTTVIC